MHMRHRHNDIIDRMKQEKHAENAYVMFVFTKLSGVDSAAWRSSGLATEARQASRDTTVSAPRDVISRFTPCTNSFSGIAPRSF